MRFKYLGELLATTNLSWEEMPDFHCGFVWQAKVGTTRQAKMNVGLGDNVPEGDLIHWSWVMEGRVLVTGVVSAAEDMKGVADLLVFINGLQTQDLIFWG